MNSAILITVIIINIRLIGLVCRVFANGPGDQKVLYLFMRIVEHNIYDWFEFGVFLLLDWMSYQGYKANSALFYPQKERKNYIKTFPKDIRYEKCKQPDPGFCPVGWDCRIHQRLLCRGVRPPPNEWPKYDTKKSDGEVPVILELWEMQSTPSLPSIPGPLRPRVVVPNRVLCMGQIELNCVLMLN